MSRVRAGLLISRPDQVLLIVVVYAVGAVAGRALEPTGGTSLAAVLWVGAVVAAVAVSVHAVNEYADAETDALTRRTRFSGGSGALAAFQLPPSFALHLARGAGACAVVLGLAAGLLVDVPDAAWPLLALGLIGGWEYSAGPVAFSRHGWGEVANAVLGGLLLPVTGAVVVGAPLGTAVAVFVPFALLDFVNLLETQWADRDADRLVGKHTLASRLSPGSIRFLGGVVALTAYALATATQPALVAAAGALALPLSAWGVWRLGRGGPGPSVTAMVVFLVAQGVAWVVLW